VPVTKPVVPPTIATDDVDDVQIPPVDAFVSAVVCPIQVFCSPDMVDAAGFTVTLNVLVQPLV
jgi:hypothetical protein